MMTAFMLLLTLTAGELGPAHPLMDRVYQLREAKDAGNYEKVAEFYAPDSRIRFEDGESKPQNVKGKDLWSEWDEVFNARSFDNATVVDGQMVRITKTEMNDWYALIGRTQSHVRIEYTFDDDGRILETHIQALDDPMAAPDKLPEFLNWLDEKHPGVRDQLMPQGEIVPTRANAERWSKLLLAWRAEVGLPDPREGC